MPNATDLPGNLLVPYAGGLSIPDIESQSKIRCSLIIPTFNEAANVEALIPRLDEILRPLLGDSFELIVVDDDSPDHTWEVALRLSARIPSLRVVRRQGERGLSTAVLRGWQVARGEVLGVIDADLQHPPEVTLELLREVARGADLAVASRNVSGGGVSDWSIVRRILSRGAQLVGLLLLPEVFGRLSDPMSGYFMVRRSAIVGVPFNPLGYKILIEVVTRGSVRWVAEAPYVFRERIDGDSKVTWKLYIEYIQHLFRLRLSTLKGSPFFRYVLVGLGAVLIDMGLLYVLSDPSQLELGIARSKLIAAQPALFWSFLFHETWTFAQVKRPGGASQITRRFLAFYAVSSVGLFIALVILSGLVHFAQLNQYLANGVAIAIVAGWNYWLHRKVTWAESTRPVDLDSPLSRLNPSEREP